MRKRAYCESELRLTVSDTSVILEESIPHDSDSHKEQTKHRLSLEVVDNIHDCIQTDMKMSATQVQRTVARYVEDDIGVASQQKIRRIVKSAKAQVMQESSVLGCGFPNTDKIGDVHQYARDHDMKALITKHNDPADSFHLGLHDMFIIGQEFSHMSVEFSLFFSSVWFLLTTFRAMIAGWGINIFTDLFHRFCTAKVKMICFGQCGVGYRLNPLMFATIPDVRGESEELYTRTFQVFTQGLQYFVTHFQYCGNAACSTCAHIRSILLHPEISQYIASRDFLQEFPNIPIRSFSSDNCSGFLKFVRTMWPSGEVVALVCSAHLTGKYASIPFLEARLMFLIAVIGAKKQRKLFKHGRNYNLLKKFLTILAKSPRHKTTMYLMTRIIKWLTDIGETTSAKWIQDYWTGERGTWDFGSTGLACPNNNCGVESGWARIRKAVCAGLKSFSYAQFMTVFLTYETEQSMDDMRTLLSATGSIFLTSAPVFDRSVWDDVCEITAKSVGEWVVQKGNSRMLKENMVQLQTFMQDTRATSLARAALDFIRDHDRPALFV
jgi:hypothetical protein